MNNDFLKSNNQTFSQYIAIKNRQQMRIWLTPLAVIVFLIGLLLPFWGQKSLLLDSGTHLLGFQALFLIIIPVLCITLWLTLPYLPRSNGYNISLLFLINFALSLLHAVMTTNSVTLAPISIILLTLLVKVMILRTREIVMIYAIGVIAGLVLIGINQEQLILSGQLFISFTLVMLWLVYIGRDHYEHTKEAFEHEKMLWKAKKQITLQLMQLESQKQKLQNLVKMDALTGLYNRGYFDIEFEKEINRADRTQSNLAVMIVDIDHFKQVNDQLGHKKGDEYIIKVAKALNSACLRKTDLVSRYGGEEFALLLPDTDQSGLETVAQNLISAIKQLQLPHPNGKVLSISIGGCEYQASGMTSNDLFNFADQALYKVKASGRDNFLIHQLSSASA